MAKMLKQGETPVAADAAKDREIAAKEREKDSDDSAPRRSLAAFLPMLVSGAVHLALVVTLALVTIAPEQALAVLETFSSMDDRETESLEEPVEIKAENPEADADSDMAETSFDSALAEPPPEAASVVDVQSAVSDVTTAPAAESMISSNALFKEHGKGGGGTGKGSMFGSSSGSLGRGMSEGTGLVGRFFDLKQDAQRNKLPYTGQFPDYIQSMNRLVAGGLAENVTRNYYEADTKLYFSQLWIPADTPAIDAPKEFNVEGKVEPRGWFVHYSGKVIPPRKGQWRFVGFFDDMLVLYVDGQPVLDGSWVPMCNVGNGPYDESLRQDFGGPGVSGERKAYAGKWINVVGPIKIDLLIGETPGGKVGGLLMCQQRETRYETRDDGTPILPLFAVTPAATERIRQDPTARRYRLVDDPPIWTPIVKRSTK